MFFCFKQKTAYEMRISDWSSDVCSSDRGPGDRRLPFQRVDAFGAQQEFGVALQEGPPDQLDIGRQRRRGLVRIGLELDQQFADHKPQRLELGVKSGIFAAQLDVAPTAVLRFLPAESEQTGRATCRERVGKYG